MNNFKSERINKHVIRIIDRFNVAMYLVIGNRQAVLLDTGFGLKGLRNYVEQLTDRPIIVCLTHGHVDHAFGIFEFDTVFMNSRDYPVFNAHSDMSYRTEFIEHENKTISISDLQREKSIEFNEIDDGDEINLGNLTIKAIAVGGHTPGLLMYLIKEDRIILFGDGVGPGTLLIEDYSTNINQYLQGLLKIKQIENEYDIVLRNHGTFVSGKDVLNNVIEAANDILNGNDAKEVLPKWFNTMFPDHNKENLSLFSARKRSKTNGSYREDGKEGNILYRQDKIKM